MCVCDVVGAVVGSIVVVGSVGGKEGAEVDLRLVVSIGFVRREMSKCRTFKAGAEAQIVPTRSSVVVQASVSLATSMSSSATIFEQSHLNLSPS